MIAQILAMMIWNGLKVEVKGAARGRSKVILSLVLRAILEIAGPVARGAIIA